MSKRASANPGSDAVILADDVAPKLISGKEFNVTSAALLDKFKKKFYLHILVDLHNAIGETNEKNNYFKKLYKVSDLK